MKPGVVQKEIAWAPNRLFKRLPVPISTCPGCGHPLVTKMMCEALEEMGIAGKAVGVNAATCGAISGVLIQVDWVFGAHGRPADIATAIKRLRPHLVVFTYQGDGDALAIGMEGTMHAALRGERITMVMVNNGNYGTTGGQMAPTTPLGMKTTTTPQGRDARRDGYPIYAPELLATLQGVAYTARGSVSSPTYYQKTKKFFKVALQKQMDDVGFSFLEILSPCPPDWHLTPVDCLKRIDQELIPQFPIGEFKNVDRLE